MTEIEKNLLVDYTNGRITLNKFYQKFPFDIRSDLGYARTEVLSSISTQNLDLMDMSITLIWLSGKPSEFVDILNKCKNC